MCEILFLKSCLFSKLWQFIEICLQKFSTNQKDWVWGWNKRTLNNEMKNYVRMVIVMVREKTKKHLRENIRIISEIRLRLTKTKNITKVKILPFRLEDEDVRCHYNVALFSFLILSMIPYGHTRQRRTHDKDLHNSAHHTHNMGVWVWVLALALFSWEVLSWYRENILFEFFHTQLFLFTYLDKHFS
jgi:hypothetical protein